MVSEASTPRTDFQDTGSDTYVRQRSGPRHASSYRSRVRRKFQHNRIASERSSYEGGASLNQLVYDQEEERQKKIAFWLNNHPVFRPGKTARERARGEIARRVANRFNRTSTNKGKVAKVK